ncbi:MAG: YncE family protein [Tepidiformaceae bacterium]
MIPSAPLETTPAVDAALARVGRTEDARFSPDGRVLILAGFERKRCLLLRITVTHTPAGPNVSADDFMELVSDGITKVHGLDFIDTHTLAVANRDGRVSIVPIPPGELGGRMCDVAALAHVGTTLFCRVKAPGSIAVRREPDGTASLLVCNNYIHRVTRHVVDPSAGYQVTANSVFLRRTLKIPDGITVSHDNRWIAVSSHHTNNVKIFDGTKSLGRLAKPVGILRDAHYPHGLRFTADDRHLLVADAGSPAIHVYDSDSGWTGTHDPRVVTVLDDETFARGRTNAEEGGPKGLDIDPSGTVVAVTCEEQSLAFHPLASFLPPD